jgi:hypothetical protein
MVIYSCFLDDINSKLDNSCMCLNKLILLLNGTFLNQQVVAPTVPLAFIASSGE